VEEELNFLFLVQKQTLLLIMSFLNQLIKSLRC